MVVYLIASVVTLTGLMAHRSSVPADDPRMRAYWTYHVERSHRVPAEGVKPDHFFACSWCRPQKSWRPLPGGGQGYVWIDVEWEQFLLPQAAAAYPIAAIAGRLG